MKQFFVRKLPLTDIRIIEAVAIFVVVLSVLYITEVFWGPALDNALLTLIGLK
jgi:hypothetical protein